MPELVDSLSAVVKAVDGNVKLEVATSGSNANGDWIRFTNGVQICWVSGSTSNISSAAGSIFVSGSVAPGSWPQAFVATPVITVAAQSSAGEAVWLAVGDGLSASGRPRVWGMCWKSVSSGAAWQMVAVGRWK